MAKRWTPAEPPGASFRLDSQRRCSRCHEPGDVLTIVRIMEHRADSVHLCARCTAVGLEAVTGYRWVAQLEQWEMQSRGAAAAREGGGASPRSRQRQTERASRRARQREEAVG